MTTTNIFFASLITFSLVLAACKKDKKDDPSDDTNDDNKAPLVTLTNPTSGVEDAPPYTETLTATASDEDGTILKVEFYVDDVKVGEDFNAPYSVTHEFTQTKGYMLKAKAIDDDGASSFSPDVSFSVGI